MIHSRADSSAPLNLNLLQPWPWTRILQKLGKLYFIALQVSELIPTIEQMERSDGLLLHYALWKP